ncbi:MFS transporter [Promicromonospora sp. Populi]|uniref:MFS transporter n=1 Tax=Promicromonospora sp. Populi TaxID=3239420 RepID=UPI0034E26F71
MSTAIPTDDRALARQELRTGWPSLVFATIGAGVGLSALNYILGPLVVPLQEEFGWGRGQISLANLWSALGLAVALPFLGRILDRFGVRRVALVSLPLFVAAVLLLGSATSSLSMFLVLYGLAGILGAGTAAVTYSKAIVERFDASRGLALGIMAGGLGAAGLLLPPIIGAVTASSGWRSAYVVMGAIAFLPLLLLLVPRLLDRPGASAKAGNSSSLPGLTVPQALRRVEFWTLCGVFLVLGWALLTMVPHFVPMLIDAGVDPVQAALLSALVGVGTVISRPIIGWLFDRVYATYVAVPLFLVAALGCLLLLWVGPGAAALTAVLIGIGFGAEIDLMAYLSSRYFGPRKFGTLYSVIYSCFIVGTALGPVAAGFLFDATESYDIALIIAASLLAVGAVVLLILPRFPERSA